MKTKMKGLVPWCVMGAGFGVWLAAMAAMAALPTNASHVASHDGGPRASAVTGLLVLHQDPRTGHSVPLRDLRPY